MRTSSSIVSSCGLRAGSDHRVTIVETGRSVQGHRERRSVLDESSDFLDGLHDHDMPEVCAEMAALARWHASCVAPAKV